MQGFLTCQLSCPLLFAWEGLRWIRSPVSSGTFHCGLLCSVLIGSLSSYGCQTVLIILCGLVSSAQKPLLGSWLPVPWNPRKGCVGISRHMRTTASDAGDSSVSFRQRQSLLRKRKGKEAVRLHGAGSRSKHLSTDSSTIIYHYSQFKSLSLPHPVSPFVNLVGKLSFLVQAFIFLGLWVHFSFTGCSCFFCSCPCSCLTVEVSSLYLRLFQRFQMEQLPPSHKKLHPSLVLLWFICSHLVHSDLFCFSFSFSFQLKGNIPISFTHTIVIKILLAQKHGPRAMRYLLESRAVPLGYFYLGLGQERPQF